MLVSPRNPLNIGAAARAMKNFGFASLRLVNAYDVAYQEARSAVGAADVLETATLHETVAEAVADCVHIAGTASTGARHLHLPCARLEEAAPALRGWIGRGPVALLFGSEKFGLSNDDLSHCDSVLAIPTGSEQPSMNLGQAVAVCLYELIRSSGPAMLWPPTRKAAAADVERLGEYLEAALRESGWVPGSTGASAEHKIRRLLRRLTLSPHDAVVAQGMMRQILWRLRNPDAR